MENQNTELPDMANSNLETQATDVTNSQTEVELDSKTEPDVKVNTDDVTEIESQNVSENGAHAVPMLTRVNQVVTTLISGVFGSLIILLSVVFLSKLGLNLKTETELIGFQSLLLGVAVFSFGLTFSQILDAYLTKLAEKENFSGVSFKAYKNISSQLILLLLSLPFLFLSLGLEPIVSIIFVGNFTIFSHIIFSQIIYFEHKYRQLGSLFGLFLSTVILNLMIFYLDLEMAPLLLLLSQPIITTLRELGAQCVDGLSNFEI